jgi:hypothetical protein
MKLQRGASLLIPVLLVIIVAAFGVMVAANQSGSDIHGTDVQADSVEALLLAETGMERAIKRFATGTACNALGETITDLSALGLTGRTIAISNGLSTDFSGTALQSASTQCRVPVTATINLDNVSRTVHAIIDKNLLNGANNFTFNNPAAVGAPSGWTLSPAAAYADNGGPDGTAPNCSRSAWFPKTTAGNTTVTTSGTATVNFTVNGGSTTTVAFHVRTVSGSSGCAALAAGPADICGGTGGLGFGVCYQMTPGAFTSGTAQLNSTAAAGASCPSPYSPCSSGYQAGYPTKSTLTIAHGAGGPYAITGFEYHLVMDRPGQKEMFLDYIEAWNNTAVGVARVQEWRDCSMSNCP